MPGERPDGLKSMKLYEQVERIHNELRELGVADGAPLRAEQLSPFDQYHYLGTDAVDAAARSLRLTAGSNVFEIGAGIGGPARHLAATVGCHVTALELQPDLHEVGAELTRRCGLDHLVAHVCGDVLDDAVDWSADRGPAAGDDPQPANAGGFDAVLSILCVLHIAERDRLFRRCAGLLRPGGRLYVEDFTKLAEPDPEQWDALRVKVQCPYLPTPAEYVGQVAGAGFAAVVLDDVTAEWTAFTAERLAAYRAGTPRHRRVHGDTVVDGLDDFYATVAALYAGGVLGGALVSATRP